MRLASDLTLCRLQPHSEKLTIFEGAELQQQATHTRMHASHLLCAAGWNLNPEEQAAFQVAERIAADEAAREAGQRQHVHQE